MKRALLIALSAHLLFLLCVRIESKSPAMLAQLPTSTVDVERPHETPTHSLTFSSYPSFKRKVITAESLKIHD